MIWKAAKVLTWAAISYWISYLLGVPLMDWATMAGAAFLSGYTLAWNEDRRRPERGKYYDD